MAVDILSSMERMPDPDVRLLAALADPVRLSIVRQLSACDECCVCDLEACGRVSQPTVSHHLRVLREAGVIRAEKRGTWVYYSLDPDAVERLQALGRSLTPAPPRTLPSSPAATRRGTRLPILESPTA
jgi:DNA-binding transcriptional ArsR family regulator